MERTLQRTALRKERHIGLDRLYNSERPVRRVKGEVTRAPTEGEHFGFLRVGNINHDVFVPQRIIKEAATRAVFAIGALVDCDIEYRGERGYRVTKIHNVHPA